jgi:hypothetical protein
VAYGADWYAATKQQAKQFTTVREEIGECGNYIMKNAA